MSEYYQEQVTGLNSERVAVINKNTSLLSVHDEDKVMNSMSLFDLQKLPENLQELSTDDKSRLKDFLLSDEAFIRMVEKTEMNRALGKHIAKALRSVQNRMTLEKGLKRVGGQGANGKIFGKGYRDRGNNIRGRQNIACRSYPSGRTHRLVRKAAKIVV